MPNEKTYAPVPVAEQGRDVMYDMSLRFAADARSRTLDGLLEHCGVPARRTPAGTVTMCIQQRVPFVPDDATIEKYADNLAKVQPEDKDVILTNIRFTGYDYIRVVKPVEPNED